MITSLMKCWKKTESRQKKARRNAFNHSFYIYKFLHIFWAIHFHADPIWKGISFFPFFSAVPPVLHIIYYRYTLYPNAFLFQFSDSIFSPATCEATVTYATWNRYTDGFSSLFLFHSSKMCDKIVHVNRNATYHTEHLVYMCVCALCTNWMISVLYGYFTFGWKKFIRIVSLLLLSIVKKKFYEYRSPRCMWEKKERKPEGAYVICYIEIKKKYFRGGKKIIHWTNSVWMSE